MLSFHFIYTEQKKKRPMHFSMRLSKSTLFSDIARYVYYVTDIHPTDGRTNEETDVLMEKLTDIYVLLYHFRFRFNVYYIFGK